jgi:hypothetical protein
MKSIQVLTDTQVKLINELCDYVESKVSPYEFDMLQFRKHGAVGDPALVIHELCTNPDPDQWVCGTAGCMIGYAPMRHSELHKDAKRWADVSDVYCKEGSPLWNFMFGAFWKGIQNTPQGSVERIRLALEFVGKLEKDQWDESMLLSHDPNGATTARMRTVLERHVQDTKDFENE